HAESAARQADAEPPRAAAHEFDDCFPDRDDAVSLLAHGRRNIAGPERKRNPQEGTRSARQPRASRDTAQPAWTGRRQMLHCNICVKSSRPTMPTPVPHPHPAPPHAHRPSETPTRAAISPSTLRMSVVERLAIAAALIVLVWGAVVWAMKV